MHVNKWNYGYKTAQFNELSCNNKVEAKVAVTFITSKGCSY